MILIIQKLIHSRARLSTFSVVDSWNEWFDLGTTIEGRSGTLSSIHSKLIKFSILATSKPFLCHHFRWNRVVSQSLGPSSTMHFCLQSQLLAMGVRSFMSGDNTLVFTLVSHMGNKSTVWISTIVTPNGAPHFYAIDWEKVYTTQWQSVCSIHSLWAARSTQMTRETFKHRIGEYTCTSRQSLCSSSRASSRAAVGGPQFEKLMRSLPLPPLILDFINHHLGWRAALRVNLFEKKWFVVVALAVLHLSHDSCAFHYSLLTTVIVAHLTLEPLFYH